MGKERTKNDLNKRFHILLSVLVLGSWTFSCTPDNTGVKIKYPKLVPIQKTGIYFGYKVTDDFQNLSDVENPQIQNWFKAQDSLAEAYFKDNPLYAQFQERFLELEDRTVGDISLISINEKGNYFYLRYDDNLGGDLLCYRESLLSEESELLAPSQYPEGSGEIVYLEPSYDGTKVAIGFDPGENFTSTVIIYDLLSKTVLKEKITNINPDFGGVEWLPDSSGFIYLYFPTIDPSEPEYKKGSYSVIHYLRQDPDKRTPIFGNNHTLAIPADYYPKVKISSSKDTHIVGYAAKSGDFYDGFIAKTSDILKGTPHWKPFFRETDKVYYNQGEIRNGQFIFRKATLDGNQLCAVTLDNPNFNTPIVLASGNREDPITKFQVSKNQIYYVREKFGTAASLFRLDSLFKETKIKLPFIPGYVDLFGESIAHNRIGIGMDGWTSDYIRYQIGIDGTFTKENLIGHTAYPEFNDLVTEQVMVVSHDGEEVPLSLIYRKDMQKHTKNEVFMYVYGAYGFSMSPFFSPIFLDWVLQGGILAFPHVRGGGEKGEQWHIQGMKSLKYNSWKDLIACTEYLMEQGYTQKGLVSLYTTSAGGITAGMAVNERPELFSSFIAEVPRMHPFGLESATRASSTSYIEYGTIKDSLECIGLISMDPYLNLKSGKTYPATLLIPSHNDDRIPLWDTGKYIAKLQNYHTGTSPILMDINYSSGHENALEYDESIKAHAKVFSFAKTHMRP